MAKKKRKKPASRRNDALANQRPGKPSKPKAKALKKAVVVGDPKLNAAFAAVVANDAKAAKALVGKVSLKDSSAQGKVKAAAEALRKNQLYKARVLLGQAASILRGL